jgi:uncharacterized membrane protein (UPF0127 family)
MEIPRPGPPVLALALLLASAVAFMLAPAATEPGLEGGDALVLSGPAVAFSGSPRPVTLSVEVADEPQEHASGLMGRESLGPGRGMLFVFEEDSQRSFWMKDTLIPLDMIFMNSSLDIVHVEEDARPCTASCSCQCPRYGSGRPAMYVVEANSGFAREHGIAEGQKASISLV